MIFGIDLQNNLVVSKKVFDEMKQFILKKGKVIYDEIYDGGGSSFGINALKDEKVKSVIKKGNIL